MPARLCIVATVALTVASVPLAHPQGMQPSLQPVTGEASWYGLNDGSTSRTASGRRFDPLQHGIAHASWPLGLHVRVTNLSNGKSTVVTVLDRAGPGVRRKGRTFDLFYGAARELDMIKTGHALVRAEPLRDEAEVAEDHPATRTALSRRPRGRPSPGRRPVVRR